MVRGFNLRALLCSPLRHGSGLSWLVGIEDAARNGNVTGTVVRIDGRDPEQHAVRKTSRKAVTQVHNSLLQLSLYRLSGENKRGSNFLSVKVRCASVRYKYNAF